MGEHKLFLSLGGNLGNKYEIFASTLHCIEVQIGRPVKVSPIYSSRSWGFESRYLFWNRVIQVETRLSPQDILREIRVIENQFGRNREPGKYLSRKMDIDILFYDDLILTEEELTIPHPLITERKFILIPFSDIAPEFVHPVSGDKISDICQKSPDKSKIYRIDFPV